jgi:hypothetical protein
LYCIECGAKNEQNAKFCYNCGVKIKQKFSSSIEDDETNNIQITDVNDKDEISFLRWCFISTTLTPYLIMFMFGLDSTMSKVFILILLIINGITAYMLSKELKKPTWLIILYSIFALFSILNIIPLIGLMADVSKILTKNDKPFEY